MQCEMCGFETDKLFRTKIEGVAMTVCNKCAKFGKFLGPLRIHSDGKPVDKKLPPPPVHEDVLEIVVDNYSQLIKNAREKLDIKQEELAKKIAEKESLITKMESGSFTPSLALAKKLEKFLKIKLIDELKDSRQIPTKTKSKGFTIGDFINVRKR